MVTRPSYLEEGLGMRPDRPQHVSQLKMRSALQTFWFSSWFGAAGDLSQPISPAIQLYSVLLNSSLLRMCTQTAPTGTSWAVSIMWLDLTRGILMQNLKCTCFKDQEQQKHFSFAPAKYSGICVISPCWTGKSPHWETLTLADGKTKGQTCSF